MTMSSLGKGCPKRVRKQNWDKRGRVASPDELIFKSQISNVDRLSCASYLLWSNIQFKKMCLAVFYHPGVIELGVISKFMNEASMMMNYNVWKWMILRKLLWNKVCDLPSIINRTGKRVLSWYISENMGIIDLIILCGWELVFVCERQRREVHRFLSHMYTCTY